MGMDVALVIQWKVDSRNKSAIDKYLYLLVIVGGTVGAEADQKGSGTVGPIFVLYNDGIAHSGADGCFFEAAA